MNGERRPATRTTAEAIDLQRLFREMLDAGDRSCAMEATSHGSALRRLDYVRFSVLVFTNLDQDHLDFHDGHGGLLRREAAAVPGRPRAAGRRQPRRSVGPPARATSSADGDAAPHLRPAPTTPRSGPPRSTVETKLVGRFNLENVLGAVAAARLLGLPEDAIARGIASVTGVPGRFQSVDEGQDFAVIVDYAHKPGALENVLRTARELADAAA